MGPRTLKRERHTSSSNFSVQSFLMITFLLRSIPCGATWISVPSHHLSKRALPSVVQCRSFMLSSAEPRSFWKHNNNVRLSKIISSRCLSADVSNEKDKPSKNNPKGSAKPSGKKISKKFKVAQDVSEKNADKLAAAFDKLASKEGFDSSMAFYADDATFEDEFDMDDDDDDDDDDYLDFGDENETFQSDSTGNEEGQKKKVVRSVNVRSEDDDMEARIAAAKKDMDQGRITVPKELDNFSKDVTENELERLGFRREANPFGNDETPRKEKFILITDALKCPACGSDFQSTSAQRPGYLPPEKFNTQVKLSKIEEMQKLQRIVESDEWSPENEIEWLIQTAGMGKRERDASDIPILDINAMAEGMELDLVELSEKKTICKRCHNLQNFGQVEEVLRPGWTKEPMLSQERFRELLRPLRDINAVIVALVDLFDFSGSVLPELDTIAGDNPVIIAANKADLLPSTMGQMRVENWVRRELEYIGIKSLANVGGSIRLISCKTGMGVEAMLDKARKLADEMDCDIYIVGAANSGKSTLMNRVLKESNQAKTDVKVRAGNKNKFKEAVTTSPLPGTTLKFIPADLGDGKTLYDTPGLLVPNTLTQLLTPEELKIVVPRSRVEPITFRIAEGKCALIGGLARIELIGDSRPFLFTFYVANAIKLHLTDSSRADTYIEKHVGTLLTPPLPPADTRMAELGAFEEHVIEVEGIGWKEAAADITLTGLGWVAITGAGKATIRISAPKGVGVELRPPLMPFDIWQTTAKYTGNRSVRKTTKSASGKRAKGVGRQ